MRRLFALIFTCILLCGVMVLPASAESAASQVDLFCTVSEEGDCFITMNVQLRLETATTGLTFPLPLEATSITLNESMASTKKTVAATEVDISRITNDYTGTASFRLAYAIPEAVKVSPEAMKINAKNKLQLVMPMLSGFQYPVEKVTFVITMPGSCVGLLPTFSSTYAQTGVESNLPYTISGNQIIGSSNTALNDRDSMTMTMMVPEEMFPTVSTYIREGNPELVPMIVFAVLAMVYWIFTLRNLPFKRIRATTSPEGISAGELGCRLTISGGDLTMMVFSWAQMGYLLIHPDGNGRVLLHKRMEMGNERNAFENQIFKALFGSRRVIDGTGYQYAKLSRKVAAMTPSERNMYKGNSGNMKIFRGLACISQSFCGICVAMNMTSVPFLQILLSIILAVFGFFSAWLIQDVAFRTHLRGKVPVLIGFVCILIWIILGLLCGQVWIPLGCCLGEFIYGYFAAYGGRRSDLGRYDAGQVLGLRHYVKHIPRDEVGRLLKNDPDYFFNMAPYALALGVINPYARAFGRRKLEQCPYLLTRVHGKRTAEEWGHLMADVADMMDAKARRMQLEKFMAIRIQITKK